jgi:hypothetical protein
MVIFWGDQTQGNCTHDRLLPGVDVELLPDITHMEVYRRLGAAGDF